MNQRAKSEQSVVESFRVVVQAVQKHSLHVEKTCGVSAVQLRAMSELSDTPGLRVSDIAARLGIKSSTASNMLDKVEKKALIQRKRESQDQRVVQLYLTKKGEKLVNSVPQNQGVILSGLAQMSDTQVKALSRNLGALVAQVQHHEQLSAREPVETNLVV